MRIQRFADLETISRTLADYFAKLAEGPDRFCVALSGGNTPKRFYELLSQRQSIDWTKVHLFLGDERWVPPADPHSNENMVLGALIDRISIPAGNVHAIYDPAGQEESAQRYDKVLHSFFAGTDSTFDLAVQGMGDDGHTASIFPMAGPTANSLPETRDWVVATTSPLPPAQRVSCTLECLAASKEVIFLVTGESKAERLKQVIDGDLRFPAAVLASRAKNVQWWVDEAAARLL